jgi:HPt (histidine-containing phosphotransfer) domain-containing protein
MPVKAKPEHIRLETVEINAAGPIASFHETMAPLTLVYARNEGGKTTIVENLIACLFRERKDGLHPSLRREFIGASRVSVRGISSKPESFTSVKNRKKIDDLIETLGTPFPPNLFDLLVVKGAELELLKQKGGITRSYLKSLISRQRLYDTLRDRLPSEVGYTELQDGILVPKRRTGGYKTYEEYRNRLDSLERAADRFYGSLSRTELMNSMSRKASLENEKKQHQLAKRHAAFILHRSIEESKTSLSRLDENRAESFADIVKDYFRTKEELLRHEEDSRFSERAEQDLDWLEQARKRYEHCLRNRANLPQAFSLLAAGIALVGSLAVYFLAPGLLPIALALSLGIFTIALLFTFVIRRGGAPESARTEMEEIRKAFKERFGTSLHSPTEFDLAKSRLDRELGKAQAVEGKRRAAASTLEELLHRIRENLAAMGYSHVQVSEWNALSQELKDKARRLRIDCNRYEERLHNLGIEARDYLEPPPGGEYSSDRERQIEQELREVEGKIHHEQEKNQGLRELFIEHLGREAARSQNIENLAIAIEDKRKEYKQQVRDLLSEMIAGHVVSEILEGFRRLEDEHLESTLNDSRISSLIKKLTAGRYDRVSLQGEQLFIENETESYDLAQMSTGAREQVLLALRMGVALVLCGKRSLFLILDDAFQYSDWQRREALVLQSVEAVRSGWQVIYFTMDDDIRDRFCKAASKLDPGTFKLIEM